MTLTTDPAPYIATAGFILTSGLVVRFGLRGVLWSLLVSIFSAMIFWLCLVAWSLLENGGSYESSRFTIWAGLGMAVPLILLFYWIGGSVGGGLVLAIRHLKRATGHIP